MITISNFVNSFYSTNDIPEYKIPEYAIIGRSNVGKSSFINMITNNKIAKQSNKPGKTRLINYFIIDKKYYLVDFPGYSYAIVSKKMRKHWNDNMNYFLLKRSNLNYTFLLIDISIPPQRIDINQIDFLHYNNIPFILIFTKSDKISNNLLNKNINIYKSIIINNINYLPLYIIVSSLKKIGKMDVYDFFHKMNKKYLNL
ncbi:MAG: YihA family ribosome biogenesis GTP-binding protein [Bacteroides sp.]|nr:MAG: YihA family ribosome biogenesis GTP-binding protein [Bacteroides sp.]